MPIINMDNKIKTYLSVAVVGVLLIFAYSAFLYADSYSKSIEPSSFRSFSASGEGKAVAIPDVAQFTFSIITEGGKDIAQLQKANTEKVNKAIEFVKSNGVLAKDIKTQNYDLSPRYQYFSCPISRDEAKPCPPAEIVGYKITQTILVKIRDFSKIGAILTGVVQSGANSVSQLSFEIDDPTAVQNKAREEAIKKAKEKAESIAKAGGFSLGRLLSIEEGGYSPQPIYSMMKSAAFGAEEALAPIIEPGSHEITINIILKYEIE